MTTNVSHTNQIEIVNTHVRAVIEYQMMGDLPGWEWALLVLEHAKGKGIIDAYQVQGVHKSVMGLEVIDFTVDVPIAPYATLAADRAREAIHPVAEQIVGEDDVTVRYVYGVSAEAERLLAKEPDFSQSHGEGWIVEVEYNTDFDGREIDPAKEEYAKTFHGAFDTIEEATAWMDAWPDGDTDLHDMRALLFNMVEPGVTPKKRVLRTAYSLLGDGQGREWGLNPEYTRATVEMVRDLLALGEVDNDAVLAMIRTQA